MTWRTICIVTLPIDNCLFPTASKFRRRSSKKACAAAGSVADLKSWQPRRQNDASEPASWPCSDGVACPGSRGRRVDGSSAALELQKVLVVTQGEIPCSTTPRWVPRPGAPRSSFVELLSTGVRRGVHTSIDAASTLILRLCWSWPRPLVGAVLHMASDNDILNDNSAFSRVWGE